MLTLCSSSSEISGKADITYNKIGKNLFINLMNKNIQIILLYTHKKNHPLIQKYFEGLEFLTPVIISAAKMCCLCAISWPILKEF